MLLQCGGLSVLCGADHVAMRRMTVLLWKAEPVTNEADCVAMGD